VWRVERDGFRLGSQIGETVRVCLSSQAGGDSALEQAGNEDTQDADW
jgi:hypothetical protein